MKRLLSLLLAFVIGVSACLTANAAVTVPSTAKAVFTISSGSCYIGETVEVTISLASTENVNSIALASFTYDADALEFVGFSDYEHIEELTILPPSFDDDKMAIVIGLKNATAFNGKIATMTFKVKSTAQEGKYTVSATPVTKNGSTVVESFVIPSEITVSEKPKADFTGLSLSNKTYTYDGTQKSIAVSGTLPQGASVAYENEKATDAGTYNVKAVVSGEGYNDLTLNAVLKIEPKSLTVSGLVAENKTYDGTRNATVSGGSLNGVISGDDVIATYPRTGTFAKADVGNGIVVDAADVVLSGADKDNYKLTQPSTLKANITKAVLKVKADDKNIVKGAVVPKLTYTITEGQLYGADTLTGSLATTANGEKLGTFDIIRGTLAVSSNYNLIFTKGTLTVVDKTPQNITVSDIAEKTYGDSSFTVAVTPDSTSQLTTFTFESSNTDVAEIEADGTVTIKAAGETDITVKQNGNEEYAAFEKTQKLVVNKKTIMVTSVNGDEKTAVLEGVLAEDTEVALDYDKLNIEVTEAASDTTSNVTFTNFELTGDKATNYTITTENVKAVMSNENIVTITITAENGTVTGAGKYIKGSSVTAKVTPNSGYNFSGWYINDTSVSTETTYNFSADADTELVAKFARRSSGGGGGGPSVSTYTVTYQTNGGSEIKKVTINKNSLLEVPEAPTKEGYTFGGWYTDKELTKAYDFTAGVTKSFTLYAKWNEIEKEPEVVEPDTTISFEDVSTDDWFYDNIRYVVENKLMTGVAEGEFAPNNTLTRAMLVTVLYRNAGEPAVNKSIPFADVDMDAYYASAVIWAKQNGIVNGITENEFTPDANITREQIAAIIHRFAQYKGYDISVGENTNILSYEDALSVSDYAMASMQYVVGSGLINGKTNSTLNPQDNATRAEIAAILHRFIENNK